MFSPSTETIIRNTSKDTYALLRLLRKDKVLLPHIPLQLPVISLGRYDIKTYKNIQFATKEVKRSIRADESTFKPTLNLLKKSSRITVKSLETAQRIKFTTFLNTYLKLRNSSLKDNEVRDLSNKLLHTLRADSRELVLCKTLQDYSDLYTKVHAYSCMSPISTYRDTKLKRYIYRKHNLWPSMWYYYNPHTKGVFLKVKGRRVARAILLRTNSKGKFTRCHSVYAESVVYRSLLIEILQSKGIEIGSLISINTTFKVPAIKILRKSVCSLPFHDCVSGTYGCFYNKKEDAFYFGPINKLPKECQRLENSYYYNGYLDSQLRPAHMHILVRSVTNAK